MFQRFFSLKNVLAAALLVVGIASTATASSLTFQLNGGFVFTNPQGNHSFLDFYQNGAFLTIDGYDTLAPTMRISGTGKLTSPTGVAANAFVQAGGNGDYKFEYNLLTGLQNVSSANPNFVFDGAFGNASGRTAGSFFGAYGTPTDNTNSAVFTAPNGLTLSLGAAGAGMHGYSAGFFITQGPGGALSIEAHAWNYIVNGGTFLNLPGALGQQFGGDFHFVGTAVKPVPEPATMALLGFGLIPLRRRLRAKKI